MIRMLISKGATVDARDERGWTPLMCAAAENFIRHMRLLIDTYGANVNAQTDHGQNVLIIAVENGFHTDISPERVLFLLRRGAKYDQRNHRGEDAETIAAHGHEITQFVLADVRAAGGIKKYLREPIVQLNCLRLLCQRGRAKAPSGVLARLFSDPLLPRELFVHVLSFWRSVRASAEDRAGDQLRGRFLPTPYSWWNGYGYRREVTWDGWVPSRVGDYSDSEYYGN